MPNDVRNFLLDKGYDVSAQILKYRAVKFTAAGTVGPVTAVGDTPIGITMEDVLTAEIAKGKGAPVAIAGVIPFLAGATACVAGNQLVLGVLADGTLVPSGTGGAGTVVVGICEQPAAANGRGSVRWML